MGKGQTVRIGRIASIYPNRHTARVEFDDTGQNSAEISVVVPSVSNVQFYCLPQVGEQVECVMRDNGQEVGYINGSFYSDECLPPFNDINIIGFKCDEDEVVYNKKTRQINIKASGNITIQGNVTIVGDVIARGVSLQNHVHGGVISGGGNTGTPQ